MVAIRLATLCGVRGGNVWRSMFKYITDYFHVAAYIIIWILVLVVGLLVEALALGLKLFPQFVGPRAFSIL